MVGGTQVTRTATDDKVRELIRDEEPQLAVRHRNRPRWRVDPLQPLQRERRAGRRSDQKQRGHLAWPPRKAEGSLMVNPHSVPLLVSEPAVAVFLSFSNTA